MHFNVLVGMFSLLRLLVVDVALVIPQAEIDSDDPTERRKLKRRLRSDVGIL